MLNKSFKRKINFKSIQFGQYCFYLGTICLSTSIVFAGLLYLIALIISFTKESIFFKRDKWHLTLLICSLILIISSINILITQNTNEIYTELKYFSWDSSAIWLNLFNWIPFFLVFSNFQIYLKNESQRIKFAKCLFIGVLPVILGLIFQKWFQITGPFIYLKGLVVFYFKPVQTLGGYAGIFSNPNYAGLWLSSTLPFCFVFLKKHKKNKIKISLLVTIIILTIYSILCTHSRNSFIGILIATSLVLGTKFLFISLFVFGLIYFLFLELSTLPFLGSLGIKEFIPEHIFNKLLNTNYLNKFQFRRIDIWDQTLKLISKRPIFGWGAGTFAIMYLIIGGQEKTQHTHSMPLEIAYSYGIPAAVIITIFVTYLFYKTWRIVFIKNKNLESLINKAWVASFLIILISHISDITYYEGRISLLIWILMTGMKCILDEDKIKNKITNINLN